MSVLFFVLLVFVVPVVSADVFCGYPPFNDQVEDCGALPVANCSGHCAEREPGVFAPCAPFAASSGGQFCTVSYDDVCTQGSCGPTCPEDLKAEHHIAGPEGSLWGISATRIFECRDSCERNKGWFPLNYSTDRCDNIGKDGKICCGKFIFPFCGDGTVNGREQCEEDIDCIINNAGTIWEDYDKCRNCMCYKSRNPIGGGSGSWTFGTTQCQGASCVFTLTPVPGAKSCLTDNDCQLGMHRECDSTWDTCDLVLNDNPLVEEANECLSNAECGTEFWESVPAADATVGENTIGQNQGCANEFYPQETEASAGSLAVLHSDRDSSDFDCKPSYDPISCETGDSACPSQGSFDYGSNVPLAGCCMQYEWECVSAECPNISNPDPSNPKISRNKNPSFTPGPGDVGKTFEFQLVAKNFSGATESAPSIVSIAVVESGIPLPPVLESLLKLSKFTAGNVDPATKQFASLEVKAKNFGSAPEEARLKLLVLDPVTNLDVGIPPIQVDSAWPISVREEYAFPVSSPFLDLGSGSYKLVAELYRIEAGTGNEILNDRKAIMFTIGGNQPIPEIIPVAGLLVALAALVILWKRR